METAAPLSQRLNLKVIPDCRLREIFVPSWQGHKFSELAEVYPEMCEIWFHDIGNFMGPDGESMRDLAARIENCLRALCAENEGKVIAVVTHATPIRAMQTLWTYGDMNRMKDVPWCNNASITCAQYDGNRFSLLYANRSEHLGEMLTTMPVRA